MAYSQNDLGWKAEKVGFSSLPFGGVLGVGCTVTTLANLFTQLHVIVGLTPDQVNEGLKAVQGFSGAYILWKQIPLAFPFVKFVTRERNYNNIKVAFYVYIKRVPVMVEVNNGGTRHWVLYIGSHQLIDPLDGKVYPTKKYEAIGYALLERV